MRRVGEKGIGRIGSWAHLINSQWRTCLTGIAAGLLVLWGGLLTPPALAAPDTHSAAFHHQACKSLLTRDEQELHLQGSCAGQIALLLQLSDVLPPTMRFCAPEHSTLRDATEVVASYMDRHVSELHLAFPVVAVLAFREAWPCQAREEAAGVRSVPTRLAHEPPVANVMPHTTFSDRELVAVGAVSPQTADTAAERQLAPAYQRRKP